MAVRSAGWNCQVARGLWRRPGTECVRLATQRTIWTKILLVADRFDSSERVCRKSQSDQSLAV